MPVVLDGLSDGSLFDVLSSAGMVLRWLLGGTGRARRNGTGWAWAGLYGLASYRSHPGGRARAVRIVCTAARPHERLAEPESTNV
ncbi:hypothetical protein GCM10009540_29920 [Streptomyces turgidiscabies]